MQLIALNPKITTQKEEFGASKFTASGLVNYEKTLENVSIQKAIVSN